MSSSRKFNPAFNIKVFIPLAIILVVFAFATAYFKIGAGLFVMFIAFAGYAVFSIWAYANTRNIAYFAAFLFQSFMATYFLTVPHGMLPIGTKAQAWFFYMCGLIVGVWLVYLMATGKGKWKGKNVFELAALQVNETVNGYTERPRPAGKLNYTKSELFGFAEFIRKNLIAIPYIENDSVVFVPVKMGEEYSFLLGMAGDHRYHSWISFNFEGNVSASISKKDYLGFTEELAFDQLCNSLGKLFIEFMEYYKKNETERILHRLNSLKYGIFG
ncbi:MAG: hypothetical protein K8R53_08035 [Bacteroidales bacterium]|nr:hypothetical protein [Bacteroidales bacterium]